VTNFIALYRGPSISEARLIAVSSEPEIVALFIRELASESSAEASLGVGEQHAAEQRQPLRLVERGEE
jgi:hypothetical protein